MTTFVRNMAGQDIEFKAILPAQFRILQRAQQSASKELARISGDGRLSDEEKFVAAGKIIGEFDMRILTMVEALVVNPEDVDHLVDAQLRGEIEPQDMLRILTSLEAEAPDDDEDPKPVAKKKAPKAVASAQRTKK